MLIEKTVAKVEVPPTPTDILPPVNVWRVLQDGSYAVIVVFIILVYLFKGKVTQVIDKHLELLNELQESLKSNTEVLHRMSRDLEEKQLIITNNTTRIDSIYRTLRGISQAVKSGKVDSHRLSSEIDENLE